VFAVPDEISAFSLVFCLLEKKPYSVVRTLFFNTEKSVEQSNLFLFALPSRYVKTGISSCEKAKAAVGKKYVNSNLHILGYVE
jgi:hypothetical protein